jgi:CDI immunity proteins
MPANTIRKLLKVELEKTGFPSNLVKTTTQLIDKDLNDFTPEDFRILIGQEMYLDIILPMAINILYKDPLVSGDYYAGDLLKTVLSISSEFWRDNPVLKTRMNLIIKKNKSKLLKVSEIKNIVDSF